LQLREVIRAYVFIPKPRFHTLLNGINKQLEKPIEANKKKVPLYSDVNKWGFSWHWIKALGFRKLLLLYLWLVQK
jgi:hypothetical protein